MGTQSIFPIFYHFFGRPLNPVLWRVDNHAWAFPFETFRFKTSEI